MKKFFQTVFDFLLLVILLIVFWLIYLLFARKSNENTTVSNDFFSSSWSTIIAGLDGNVLNADSTNELESHGASGNDNYVTKGGGGKSGGAGSSGTI